VSVTEGRFDVVVVVVVVEEEEEVAIVIWIRLQVRASCGGRRQGD
jgi:hypothetical protein